MNATGPAVLEPSYPVLPEPASLDPVLVPRSLNAATLAPFREVPTSVGNGMAAYSRATALALASRRRSWPTGSATGTDDGAALVAAVRWSVGTDAAVSAGVTARADTADDATPCVATIADDDGGAVPAAAVSPDEPGDEGAEEPADGGPDEGAGEAKEDGTRCTRTTRADGAAGAPAGRTASLCSGSPGPGSTVERWIEVFRPPTCKGATSPRIVGDIGAETRGSGTTASPTGTTSAGPALAPTGTAAAGCPWAGSAQSSGWIASTSALEDSGPVAGATAGDASGVLARCSGMPGGGACFGGAALTPGNATSVNPLSAARCACNAGLGRSADGVPVAVGGTSDNGGPKPRRGRSPVTAWPATGAADATLWIGRAAGVPGIAEGAPVLPSGAGVGDPGARVEVPSVDADAGTSGERFAGATDSCACP